MLQDQTTTSDFMDYLDLVQIPGANVKRFFSGHIASLILNDTFYKMNFFSGHKAW